MKYLLAAAAALSAVTMASPAAAIVFTSGTSIDYLFNGVDGDGNPAAGATAALTLTLESLAGGVANFSYLLSNTSDGMLQPEIRVTAFGFNASPNNAASGVALTGLSTLSFNGNFNQAGNRYVCVHAGPTCSGGGGGGVDLGDSLGGTFRLTYADTMLASLNLNDLVVRYQSLGRDGEDSGVGYGRPDTFQNPIPEPATWAMMIAGFGFVGATLRRRRADPIARVRA